MLRFLKQGTSGHRSHFGKPLELLGLSIMASVVVSFQLKREKKEK